MASKFYFGSGSATPAAVVEKEIPVIPTATVPFVVTNGYAHKGTNEGLNLAGVTGVQYNMYTDAYEENPNIVGPAIVNVNPNLFTNCGNYAFYGTFWNCANLTDTGFNPVTNINGNYICSYMYGRCPKLPDTQLTNVVSIIGDGACQEMFRNCEGLISTGLDNLTNISGIRACYSMFASCTNLTYMNLSNLQNISGNFATAYMFSECPNISVVDMSNVQGILGYNACQNMFLNVPNITSVYLNNLTYIARDNACRALFAEQVNLTEVNMGKMLTVSEAYAAANMFQNCTNLVTANISSLSSIFASSGCEQMFYRCYNLTSVDLSNLNTISGQNACQNMFAGCFNMKCPINLSGLRSVSGTNACQRMFFQSGITSVDISGWPANFVPSRNTFNIAFYYCGNLTEVNFGNRTFFPFNSYGVFMQAGLHASGMKYMTTLNTYMIGAFQGNPNLVDAQVENITTINTSIERCFAQTGVIDVCFKNLRTLGNNSDLKQLFWGTSIQSLHFPNLTTLPSNKNIFNQMLWYTQDCTVYFPPALRSTLETYSDVIAGFGGTNTEVKYMVCHELPVNLPSGYRVWLDKNEVTNKEVVYLEDNETYSMIIKQDSTTNSPAKLAVFDYTPTASTTEFTFDPSTITYSTVNVSWTGTSNILKVEAVYTGKALVTAELDISNNPSQVLLSPNTIEVELTGIATDGYLPNSYIITPAETSSVMLEFEAFDPNYISVNQLKNQIGGTFVGTGAGFDFTKETIDAVEYFRMHSHGINTEGAGYIKFNAADLQGYSTLTVSGSAFASCEQDYDFGYILYGDHFSRPTTRDEIYNQTTFDGNTYIINQSGHNNTSTPFQITFNIDPQDPKDFYVIIGFCEDYLYNEDPDSIYVSGLTVTLS